MFHKRIRRTSQTGESGQALIEFSLVVIVLIVLMFGLIDVCQAIYTRQVIVNLAREGANLASRGTGDTRSEIISNAVAAVVDAASPLSITTNGVVIITAVTNNARGSYFISLQQRQGALTFASKIGTRVGQSATLPITSPSLSQPNYTVYVAEIYYKFKPITPIGSLLRVAIPTNLYDVAYFTTF
jgi:Flp pilus assembly protein TadG